MSGKSYKYYDLIT